MWKSAQRLCGVLCVFALAACASGGQSAGNSPRPGSSRDLLTQEDIGQVGGKTAYDVVETLRGNWLRTRGRTSLNGPDAQVLVYVNDTRVGGVEQLRAIPAMTVTYIRWYDGIAASGRWGLDHGAGVIYVSTRNEAPGR